MNFIGRNCDRTNLLDGIRVVVFDAVGTLMYPDPSVASVYVDVIQRRTKLPVDITNVRQSVVTALARRNASGDLQTCEADESQFWFQLIEQLCPVRSESQNCFEDLFAHFACAQNWRCFPDADGLVHGLQERGIAVAIGSNFDSRLHAVCDGLSQLSDIDLRFISSEVGWRKPAPQYFQAVAARTGSAVCEILMVGDDHQNDIEGALSVGFRAAWINRSATAGTTDVDHRYTRLTSLTELFAQAATEETTLPRDPGAGR